MENTVTYKSSSRRGRQPYLPPQEAKRRRLERYRLRRLRMVDIGGETESWHQLKLELGFEKDASFAKFLLDYYRSHSVSKMLHSDPKTKKEIVHHKGKDESNNATCTSSSENQNEQRIRSSLIMTFPHRTTSQPLSTASLSSVDSDMDTDHDKGSLEFVEDPVDVTEYLLPGNFLNTKLRDCTIEEEVLNIINDEVKSEEEESIPVSVASAQGKSICSMRTGIVFDTCLMSLAEKAFSRCECLNCDGKIDLELHVVATALKVVIHCCHGHESVWWSQPLLEGVPAGNILLVSSIVLSGNNYRKIALMLKFLNMLPVSHQSFLKIQKSYVQPSVTNYWKTMQGKHFLEHTHPVVVLGDQCNNSHVLSEKYLTYTMMDNSTHKILDVQVIDAREGTRKLRNLEISGFQRAFQCLVQNSLDVSEIVTDADPQILTMMKLKYPNVLHQLDLWHGIKAVHKRLNKVVASSDNKDLQPWISDIIRHFMYCCQHSNGDVNTLMARWRSILHHTVNVHEWQLGDCSTTASCEHGPLTAKEIKDKPWLTAGSPAHHALRKVVYDKWLTSHLNYFIQARVTNELESFNNHIQMYAAKNFTYEHEDYLVRTLLAAIDYNSHIDREYQRNADGGIVYHRMYSKCRKHWRAVPAKVQKQYNYFEGLREDMVKAISSKDTILPRKLGAKGRRVLAPAKQCNFHLKIK
ncbi:uncharacterized protein LOC121280414 isoform X1 [Carcharodon carcharias]|uniref:uncharacterized protein LOC121280414 isoform X1 n=1 Tax=Carcharodon carcharias TaxID=13397 RepID=UPI001B7F6EBA|nr:uncharacterized protein LOC121280414 isoform X1 [Carcharodon carcharias]XP_041048315.1 uncharacterized protein LOC121280414 isoform X1 [Carcharodon carcharias]